jgi:2-phospho-L-lactate guanylyltransferase
LLIFAFALDFPFEVKALAADNGETGRRGRAAAPLVPAGKTHIVVLDGPYYDQGMQGTVATWNTESRSGTVLLDNGVELTFPTEAFDASGLRLLRLGQRVRLDTGDDGQIYRLAIPTMP